MSGHGPAEAAALAVAKSRLDELDLYATPVRIDSVRVVHASWAFRLPGMRRFAGYASWGLILLRDGLEGASEDLVTHELCHVWQMQHHPLRMPLSYVLTGYADNPYELEARRAAARTAAT